jgi:hypothetical protein
MHVEEEEVPRRTPISGPIEFVSIGYYTHCMKISF